MLELRKIALAALVVASIVGTGVPATAGDVLPLGDVCDESYEYGEWSFDPSGIKYGPGHAVEGTERHITDGGEKSYSSTNTRTRTASGTASAELRNKVGVDLKVLSGEVETKFGISATVSLTETKTISITETYKKPGHYYDWIGAALLPYKRTWERQAPSCSISSGIGTFYVPRVISRTFVTDDSGVTHYPMLTAGQFGICPNGRPAPENCQPGGQSIAPSAGASSAGREVTTSDNEAYWVTGTSSDLVRNANVTIAQTAPRPAPPAYSKNTVRTANNHLVNFVRTTNNDLYSYDPLAEGWKLIGIGVVGEPQAIIHPVTGRVNVYVRDTQNQLLVNDLGGTGWSVIGIGIASNPSVLVHPATGRVNVYVRTTNNDLMVHDLGGTGWSVIGIGVTGNPTAATHPATGRVNVYTRVGTNLMVHDLGGTGWSTIGIGIVSDPVVAVHPYNARVNVYVRNANNDLLLHDLGGTGWSTVGIGVIGTPTVGVHPDTGRVNIYVRNANNDLLLHDLGGTGWSTVGIGVATDPTLIMGADRRRYLFATSTDHVLLRKDMDGPTGWTRHGMDIA
ncbi:hypothetical protein AB0M43_20560 [Longispora sp. NPDC051575]|uniref:hypothetical protein n=1 Tax=Longispora sp. NPDC051575 TaxID=3154943 RepID=UPI00341AB605